MPFGTLWEVLILASASPRRHDLLAAAGIDHVVRPAAVPEIRQPGEQPSAFVARLAEQKARAIECNLSDTVLGADTIVEIDGEVLGKPQDEADARGMLRRLAGREHWVHTGICLLNNRKCLVDVASTRVSFAPLTDHEIWEYTRSGEPTDKAGGYAIQGLAAKFIVSIEGSYTNVVGLPVALVYHHWKSLSA